jgi:hypothetical protein
MMSALARTVLTMAPRWFGALPLALALAGVLAAMSPSESARRTARRGLVLSMSGLVLMAGPMLVMGEHRIALPFGWLAETPARFFRFPWRFVVVTGFGTALLAAAALEAGRVRLGRRAGTALVLMAALLTLGTRGMGFVRAGLEPVPAQTRRVYDLVRAVTADRGKGPLLELPLADAEGRSYEWEAMLGSTRHWLPLVTGIRSYPPPHRRLLLDRIRRLPAKPALQDLVDMTHVRWLLLRPVPDWPDPEVRAGLLASPDVQPVAIEEGWILAQLRRQPERAEWFQAIAAGAQRADGPAPKNPEP